MVEGAGFVDSGCGHSCVSGRLLGRKLAILLPLRGDRPQYLPTRHGFDDWFGIPYSNNMMATLEPGERRAAFVAPKIEYWDCRFRPQHFDCGEFLGDDHAVAALIEEFPATGACVLTHGPTEPGSVEQLASRLGPVREVVFERIHNVEIDPKGYNIAHTNVDVPPHNDLVSYT